MIDKIKEVYERINGEFISGSSFGQMNTKDFRIKFKERLQNEITGSDVKCDAENNPTDVIDLCCLVARISWTEDRQNKYCDLVFGQPKQAMEIHQRFI